MGDHSAQGAGVCLFLVGFTLIAMALASVGIPILFGVAGIALVAFSAAMLRKAKTAADSE